MQYNNAIILSGEGITGTLSTHTGRPTLAAINRRLAKERCGGDRWARAFTPAGDGYAPDAYVDIHTGEMRTIDPEDVEE